MCYRYRRQLGKNIGVLGSKNMILNNLDNITSVKCIIGLFARKYNNLYHSLSNTVDVDDCSSMKTTIK